MTDIKKDAGTAKPCALCGFAAPAPLKYFVTGPSVLRCIFWL